MTHISYINCSLVTLKCSMIED